jgi:hypothetical protein
MHAGEGLEARAPLRERPGHQRSALGVHEDIEGDQQRRRLLGEPAHTRGRRVDALEQIVEREVALHRHDQLPVQHEAARGHRTHRRHDVGEIALQRLARLGPEGDRLAVAEDEAAEPVPLGLVLPARARRDLVHEPRLHGRVVEAER